jgi:hypothetical protein
MLTPQITKTLVQALWTSATQVGHAANAQIGQILCETRANAGNPLEIP